MLDISFSSYFLYLQGNPAEQTEQEEEREQIRFGEPCENTRKHSKFDFADDLVVVPVEIEIQSE